MSTYTVASAITRCRRIVSMGSDVALEYLQTALDELSLELPVYVVAEDIASVSGTREYAVNAACRRIWAVEWVTGAESTDRRKLRATNVQELDRTEYSWRRRTTGIPRRRYTTLLLDQPAVGLHPIPNESASGGYPLIRVHQSRTMTLASDGNLPRNLQSTSVLVNKACLLYAIDNQLDKRLATLRSEYEASFLAEKNANAVIGFYDVEDAPTMAPYELRVPSSV